MRGDEYGDTDARAARFGWLGRAAIRRAIADRALLAPALVCCILATTLSAAGPIFSSAVATAGVRAALARAPATASNLRVTAPVHAAPSAELDGQATRAIAAATAPAGAAIGRQLRSGSFTVDGRAELVELAWFDDADAVTAVAGAMPSRVGEIAAPEPVARALGWSAGDSVVLRDTTTDAPTRVTVSALYRAGDADAVRWWGAAPVAGTDWRRGGFTIYGPLLTTRDTLLDRLGADQAWWTATLAIERLDAGDVDRVRRATDGFVSRSGDGLDVTTGLPSLLDAAGQRLLASRAAVLTVVLQLLVLAVAALVLAAQLIVSERSVETALLRSRGAGIGQLAAIAAIEAVLVVAPAVAVGPPLGRIVVAMLDDAGALRAAGLVLQPTVTASSMLLSAAAGAVAAVALWLPTVAAERGFAASQRARGRQRRAGAAQRLGVDLALLAVAAVGYWQLRQADGPLTTGVRGAVGVDPLLVAAPALCLLTGAVLALRAVPFLAGLAERVAVTGHGIIPALGAWQVARRPRGYARAALLPVLAIGLGSFAVSYGSTRDAAQASQVATVVPADLRVTPGRSAEVTPARLPGAYLDLPGVTGVVPALQATVPISPDAGRAGVLAVDTGGRDLLSAGPDLRTAMATLARGRPALPVVRLPAGTVRLQVAVTTTLTVPPAGDPTTAPAADPFAAGGPQVHLLIRDRFGLVHALAAGDLPADGDRSPLRVDLDGLARPLALAGVDLDLPVDPFTPYRCRVGVSVRDDHGGTVRLQPGWSARTAARDAALVTPRAAAAPGPGAAAALDVRRSPGGPTRALVHLLPAGGTPPDDVGVVLTGPLARTLEVERGGRLPLQVAGLSWTHASSRSSTPSRRCPTTHRPAARCWTWARSPPPASRRRRNPSSRRRGSSRSTARRRRSPDGCAASRRPAPRCSTVRR